jgi:hypothetical protein
LEFVGRSEGGVAEGDGFEVEGGYVGEEGGVFAAGREKVGMSGVELVGEDGGADETGDG